MPTPHKPPPGSIDFAITEFDDARRSLNKWPAGVAELNRVMCADEWASHLRGPLLTDSALTGVAMHWVIGLPFDVRPLAACEQFFRAVKAIDAFWSNVHCSLPVVN